MTNMSGHSSVVEYQLPKLWVASSTLVARSSFNKKGELRMKKTVLVFLCLAFGCLFARDIDVLHLKNGDIVKGTIIEKIPDKSVKIKLEGGSIFTYKYTEISQFSVEDEKLISQDLKKTALSAATVTAISVLGTLLIIMIIL